MSHIVSWRRKGCAHRTFQAHRSRDAAWAHFMTLGRDPAFVGVRIRSVES